MLDCSCGIGTQSIGLAVFGYNVYGSDLSEKAIERAKIEAKKLKLNMKFSVADFKTLDKDIDGKYDVVLTADNSLPHILKEEDLKITINNIWGKLNQKGLFLATIRDYDEIFKSKMTGTNPINR